MNVLVVGCGRLGTQLATMLDEYGHDVAVVDSDPVSFLNLSENFSGITVAGMPMDMTVLKSAGAENCDAMAVVTPDDNLNITISQIAHRFFGVENVVARISDPAREKVFKSFGLKTVCPTKLAGDAIFTALTQPWEDKNLTFETATAAFHCRVVDKAHDGLTISTVPMANGEAVFGVVGIDGTMKLYSQVQNKPLIQGEKVVFAKIVD